MSFEANSRPGSDAGDQAVPCEGADCPFWGKASTQNMCSQCYSTHLKKNQSRMTGAAEITKEKPKVVEEPAKEAINDVEVTIKPDEEEIVKQAEKVLDESPPPTPARAMQEPVKKMQKDKRRCMECNKFMGFTGIKCKCGYTFCGSHRYPEKHSCDFDFEAAARDRFRHNRADAAVADKIDGERL